MKKIICSFAFAAVLTAVSTADAMVNSLITENNNNNNLQTVQKELCYMTIDGKEDCSNLIQKPILDPIVPVNPDPVDPVIPVIPRDPVILDPVIPVVTTATVSSCPSGMTKSSDGCCCVNN